MSKSQNSAIINNVLSGAYVSMRKFANYGSVIEDSIIAQQREFEKKLRAIQEAKKNKKK
tara:strand:+ start:2800 stop:2976 length:177 start_codon:yes stop_codon:yes gene_type:complete